MYKLSRLSGTWPRWLFDACPGKKHRFSRPIQRMLLSRPEIRKFSVRVIKCSVQVNRSFIQHSFGDFLDTFRVFISD